MEIKVSRIKEERLFDGTKTYTEIDITDQVVMPIIDVERLDATLDTTSLTLINTEENAIVPFTRMIIRIKNADNTTDNIYRLVERDDVSIYKYGSNPKYQHELQLVEITKWLERFEVDNTTITNMLMFLYTDDSVINSLGIDAVPNITEETSEGSTWVEATTCDKIDEFPIYNTYIQGSTINNSLRYNCTVKYRSVYGGSFLGDLFPRYDTVNANLKTYTINDQSVLNTNTYTFTQPGTYTIQQFYETDEIVTGIVTGHLNRLVGKYGITITYTINVIEPTQIEKLPSKYTLSQVVDVVLNKIGNETTVIREGIDSPMFQLDPQIRAKFDTLIAPEFTFTQDTLFGVLSKIGEVAHAIPRLLPNPVNEVVRVDDYTDWNIITYDFLGGNEEANEGEVVGKGSYYDGNDYTTNYVSNVQNSFQTNDAEYICLTEPHDGGWVSPRTEASDYLVTNNEAVIKTSRPIQRIVSLECLVYQNGTEKVLDLSTRIKEVTDYNLLSTYSTTLSIGSKQNYIYYTRGSNVIGGLTYRAPETLSAFNFLQKTAIENVIEIANSFVAIPNIQIPNLKFRIKYVPYYDLKIKQYKPYITDNSGNNELYYNQINSQTVDIESLGEAMKGALLRVSNEEPNLTEYFDNHNECIKSGQLLNDEYYVYQVNKEINTKRIKASVQFSKDFNKWNAYVAIKKNYREWEISERESIETNPVYNNFCIISDKPEVYLLVDHVVDGETTYIWETEEPLTDNAMNITLYYWTHTPAEEYMFINKVGEKYYKRKRQLDTYGSTTWSSEEIFVVDDVLEINDKVITNEELTKYNDILTTEKGVLNSNFYTQLVRRMSNDSTNPMYKISWVVGDIYSNEWQGGLEYKQIRKSFMLPCACFSVGNSIVFDFGAKDNYAMATHVNYETVTEGSVTHEANQEEYVQYGNKFGKADYLELQYGHDAVISDGYNTESDATTTAKNWYLVDPRKVVKNNVFLDYQNNNNYIIMVSKYERIIHFDAGMFVLDGITYWYYFPDDNHLTIIPESGTPVYYLTEAGGGYSFQPGTTSYSIRTNTYDWQNGGTTINVLYFPLIGDPTLITTSTLTGVICELTVDDTTYYSVPRLSDDTIYFEPENERYTIAELDKGYRYLHLTRTVNDVTTNYYSQKTVNGMFKINKDSRQSLQFTNQLHFVTDCKDIQIGSALAKTMPFVGNTENGIYKLVGFTQRPSKFEIVATNFEEITTPWDMRSWSSIYSMTLVGTEVQNNYKGFGIVDNKNRLVLYYNKELKTGDTTPTLYFRLRRKI